MKTHNSYRSLALAPLVLAPFIPLHAAEYDAVSRVRLEEPKENPNRFSVSFSAAWNVKADFSRSGGRGAHIPPPSAGGQTNRVYDDGFNKLDNKGNATGLTSFWGYKNDSQLDLANDRLLMHSTRTTGVEIKGVEDDPQLGFQITWNRELGRAKDNKWSWGVEAAFGWTFIDISDGSRTRGGTKTIEDAYNLNGTQPPWQGETGDPNFPGHAGPFDPETTGGTATLIDSAPSSRQVINNRNGAIITGSRDFDGDWYFGRVGPYIEFPITEKLSAQVSAGIAIGVVDGSLHFNEMIVVPAAGTSKRERGTVDEAQAVVGGFISATLNYAFDDKWSVFAGGQFQGMTEYEASGKGRKVTLDLSTVPFGVVGVSYAF